MPALGNWEPVSSSTLFWCFFCGCLVLFGVFFGGFLMFFLWLLMVFWWFFDVFFVVVDGFLVVF